MPIFLRQQARVGAYLTRRKLQRANRFPLIVELEPLFACNLSCAGCGKTEYPPDVRRLHMPVDTALAAMRESGAPMVSIAGGEPLLHPEIDRMTSELLRRKLVVYLCTNGLLMREKLHLFTPSPSFAWVVHVDGLRERHDELVGRPGVFDEAIAAIRAAKAAGFNVTTNSTFFADDSPAMVRDVLDFLNDDLRVNAMMVSPGYSYERAADQQHFLARAQTHSLFRAVFADGRRKRWRLNHSPLFLDFLAGKVDFDCTPWGIPCYSVLGWQRPCYLRADDHCATFRELVETTDWSRYGPRSGDPRCRDCMAHCGYESTAVLATLRSPREAIRALTSN